jgi:hypothetical protein
MSDAPKADQPKPCDEPKFIDGENTVALVIKDYARRSDLPFLQGNNPENDSDDGSMMLATMHLLSMKKDINKLRADIYNFPDKVDFDRPIMVAQRTDYDSRGFEVGLTKSFDIVDVMMAAQQLADELQELVDDWWDSLDASEEPNSQPPPAEERPPAAGKQGTLF